MELIGILGKDPQNTLVWTFKRINYCPDLCPVLAP